MNFADLFVKYDTDKQRLMGYGPIYDELTRGLVVTRVLEIGVRRGASLLAWADAFPEAAIYGLDVSSEAGDLVREHSRIFVINDDSTDHDSVPVCPPFDLIVDDGCHAFVAQSLTMQNFLPLLARGGVYVIEDVETDANAAALISEAEDMGHTAELLRSDAAPGICDNRLVVIR